MISKEVRLAYLQAELDFLEERQNHDGGVWTFNGNPTVAVIRSIMADVDAAAVPTQKGQDPKQPDHEQLALPL